MFIKFVKTLSNHKQIINCILRKHSTSADLTRIEFTNGIKTITMTNQKTRNALSIAMMQNLIDNIKNDENNLDLRAIVLAAEGPIFSAGHNLKELKQESGQSQIEKVFKTATILMHSLIDCPVPVIAKVDGHAAAAGCQLVAQCDIAICSENSQFSTPGANFGIFCSTPGVALARNVQQKTAMHMLLTGLAISSDKAKNCGLVSQVCSSKDLDKEVAIVCEAIRSKSRVVIELGKKFYYKQIQVNVKTAYEIGGQQMVDNLLLEEGQEGIKSFIEKRKPVWKK